MTKWRPPQWCPFLSFYSIRRADRYKRETKYSFIQWVIFAFILGGEIDGALTPSPHTHTLPCPLLTTPRTSMYSPLVYMCMCTSHLHFMNFLVHFSTLHFTFGPILILQIHYVHVQCCTSRFYSFCSVLSSWPKILTTPQ